MEARIAQKNHHLFIHSYHMAFHQQSIQWPRDIPTIKIVYIQICHKMGKLILSARCSILPLAWGPKP